MDAEASPPKPYTIHVPDSTLDWISNRLETARFPHSFDFSSDSGAWSHGVHPDTVKRLVLHWRTGYNWRAVESSLNTRLRHFTSAVTLTSISETLNIHFIHHRSPHTNAIPLLFLHGWPGNFTEIEPILPQLLEPDDADHRPAFHVVSASLPGFAFSSSPTKPDFTFKAYAGVFHALMTKSLGYSHYTIQAGDFGSMIARCMAIDYPDSVCALHINLVVALPPPLFKKPIALASLVLRWFTKEEKDRLAKFQWWRASESGYSAIMSTKPSTIAFLLSDSPVGQLAWIRDKMEPLSPTMLKDNAEKMITWTMLYLIANSVANSSIYRTAMGGELANEVLGRCISEKVKVGYSSFKGDIGYIPRWWAEGTVAESFAVWREHEGGSHFPGFDEPEKMLRDIADTVKAVGEARMEDLRRAGEKGTA